MNINYVLYCAICLFLCVSCNKKMLLTGDQNTFPSFDTSTFGKGTNQEEGVKTFDEGVYSLFICERLESFKGTSANRKKEKSYLRRKFAVCDGCENEYFSNFEDTLLDAKPEGRHQNFRGLLAEHFENPDALPKNTGSSWLIESISFMFLDDQRIILHSTNMRGRAGDDQEIKPLDFNYKKWFNKDASRGYYKLDENGQFDCVLEIARGKQFKLRGSWTPDKITIASITSDDWYFSDPDFEETRRPIDSVFGLGQKVLIFKYYDLRKPLVPLEIDSVGIKSVERVPDGWKYLLDDQTEKTSSLYWPW